MKLFSFTFFIFLKIGQNTAEEGIVLDNQMNQPISAIKNFGQPQLPPTTQKTPEIYCMTIVGQIEGHLMLPVKNKATKYEHVIPQLVAIEQSEDVKGVLLVLNTVGGDIEAGLAIAEMITSLSKPVVSLVLGGGHSIGVPIAVAANYSFIAETATMTIHPIRLSGLVIGVPQTYEYLDKMQDRVIRFITNHSGIDETSLRDYMFRTGELVRDVGTVLVGREAVDAGLVNSVGGLSEAINKINELCGISRIEQNLYANQFNYQPHHQPAPNYASRPNQPQHSNMPFTNPNPGGMYS